jgi:hypothetical protein
MTIAGYGDFEATIEASDLPPETKAAILGVHRRRIFASAYYRLRCIAASIPLALSPSKPWGCGSSRSARAIFSP